MHFNNKRKLILWILVLGFTLLACTRVASETPAGNTTSEEDFSQETATPNFFLTEFIETANSPTETPTVAPSATVEEMVGEATEVVEETAMPGMDETTIAETATPDAVTSNGNVFMKPFVLTDLDFDLPENLEGSLSRSGPVLNAVYLPEAPVIDGNILEWDGTAYAMGYLVLGQEFYSGTEDIYGIGMLGWDETYFYLGVQVTDNKFVQTAQGNDIYRGDSIELMIDADLSGDFEIDYLDEDDYQMGISPGNLNSDEISPEAYLWSPLEIFGSVEGVMIASGFTDVGYTMEIAIPWEVFDIDAEENTVMGFLLNVSDNDYVNQNSQQSVVSFAPERTLNDPTGWFTLLLTMPEAVE